MARRVPTAESVPVALAIVDASTLVIEWYNEYLCAMAGRFTDEEIMGHPIGQFLPIEQVPEIEQAFNNCSDTGEPAFLEGEIVGHAGVMPLFASVYRIPNNKLLIAAWHPVTEPTGPSDEPIGTVHPKSIITGQGEAE